MELKTYYLLWAPDRMWLTATGPVIEKGRKPIDTEPRLAHAVLAECQAENWKAAKAQMMGGAA